MLPALRWASPALARGNLTVTADGPDSLRLRLDHRSFALVRDQAFHPSATIIEPTRGSYAPPSLGIYKTSATSASGEWVRATLACDESDGRRCLFDTFCSF